MHPRRLLGKTAAINQTQHRRPATWASPAPVTRRQRPAFSGAKKQPQVGGAQVLRGLAAGGQRHTTQPHLDPAWPSPFLPFSSATPSALWPARASFLTSARRCFKASISSCKSTWPVDLGPYTTRAIVPLWMDLSVFRTQSSFNWIQVVLRLRHRNRSAPPLSSSWWT